MLAFRSQAWERGRRAFTGIPLGSRRKVSRRQVGQCHNCRTRHRAPRAAGDRDPSVVELPHVKPRISYVFLAANLAVYAAGIVVALTDGGEASNEFFLSLAKVNSEVVRGEWWRLLSANFMHAGLLHLGLNSTALYIVAPEVESVLGYGTFAAIYTLSGVAGSVASFALEDLVTVGASAAVFGCLGALAAYFVRNPALERRVQQLFYIVAIVTGDFLLGLDGASMVDNNGHIAGFLSGFVLGLVMSPQYRIVKYSTPVPVPETEATADEPAPGSAVEQRSEPLPAASEPQAPREATATEAPAAALSAIEASLAKLEQLTFAAEPEVAEAAVKERPPVTAPGPSPTVWFAVDQTSNTVRVASSLAFTVTLALATMAAIGQYAAPPG